jgi:predicted dienelactone hydrolase
MRFLELLLIANILVIVLVSLRVRQRPGWFGWLAVTAVFTLFAHLVIEGYRWQMVPTYLLAAGQVLITLKRWRLPVLGSIVGLILLAIAATLPILLPVPRPMEPTGPYAVGTAVYHLIDASRDEFYSDAFGDNRELMIQVWYPAELPSPGTKPALYLEDIDVAGPAIARRLALPPFLLDHLNLATTHSFTNAPIFSEGTAYPVIIFSHGLRGFRNQNTTMVQELASHGYVVAAVDHTYANIISVFPDGRITFYNPAIFAEESADPPRNAHTLITVWALDIAFVLDEMARWQNENGNRFNGRLDLDHIGVFGHSTGGGATAEFCANDPRCGAGLGLDAWVEPVSDAVLKNLATPYMFIQADKWTSPNSNNADRVQAIFEGSQAASYSLIVEGAAHYDFTDLPLFSPLTPQLGLSSDIPGNRMASLLNDYALAFFNWHLKGGSSGLLKGTAVYPEVTFSSRRS